MNLSWIPYGGKGTIRSARSKAWDFTGHLIVSANDNSGKAVNFDYAYLYCKFCFEEQLNESEGSLAKVYITSPVTASGNWLSHATAKHSKTFEKEVNPKVNSIAT